MSRKTKKQGTESRDKARGAGSALTGAEPARAVPWRGLRVLEWSALGILAVVILGLHVTLYLHAGAFWRDETTTIEVAENPSLLGTWSWLRTDSFPGLFSSSLHLWIQSGGATDAGIRFFGTLIGLGGAATLIYSCWTLTRQVPLVATALVALNGAVFYFGTSLRAYGLAGLLVTACFAVFWKLAERPNKGNVALALLIALLTVHSNYQNSYLFFGIGVAAAAACGLCRLWMRSLLVLAICFFAAISLLIYIPTMRAYLVTLPLSTFDLTGPLLAEKLAEAVGGTSTGLLILWIGLTVSALVLLAVAAVHQRKGPGPSLEIYTLVAAVVAMGTGFFFFRANGMFPFPWHFLPFIALAGVAIEIGLQSLPRAWHGEWVRIAVAGCLVVFSIGPLWQLANLRRTNLDLVCRILEQEANPSDLILLANIWLVPGFGYHYHGAAQWNPIPSIPKEPDAIPSPFPYLMARMTDPNVLEPTLQDIRTTLASGHRVWIVGVIEAPPANTLPPTLSPPPHPIYGWNHNTYGLAWRMQTAYYLQGHALQARPVAVPVDQPVSPMETMPLTVIEGWRP